MNQGVAPAVWIDRAAELRRLREAIRERESLLIWGPGGAGKTALVSKVLAELPRPLARCCLYVSGSENPQDVLRRLCAELYEARDRHLLQRLRAEGIPESGFRGWLRRQTSLHLKGRLYRAASATHYWVFLDHLPPIRGSLMRVVEELVRMCKTPVYLLARGFTPMEVGRAWSLYWSDRHRLPLASLPESAARELVGRCIARFGLSHLELEEFREEVLRLSDGIPGAIVEMCALAAQPKYHFGRQIKTKTLYLDYLLGQRNGLVRRPEKSFGNE